jgi:hypothetical protein
MNMPQYYVKCAFPVILKGAVTRTAIRVGERGVCVLRTIIIIIIIVIM